jgi:hypothetical protein
MSDKGKGKRKWNPIDSESEDISSKAPKVHKIIVCVSLIKVLYFWNLITKF